MKLRPLAREMLIVFSVIFVLAVTLFHIRREQRRQQICQSNLKLIGLAMLQYVKDYDEQYPPAQAWAELLMPYGWHRISYSPLDCPEQPLGYALNAKLQRIEMASVVDYQNTVQVFESKAARANAADTGYSWLDKARHTKGIGVSWTDGHVSFVKNRPAPRFWNPDGKP